jgi:hypothetical protein
VFWDRRKNPVLLGAALLVFLLGIVNSTNILFQLARCHATVFTLVSLFTAVLNQI